MSEEKKGQQYLAALHQAFPGVVLEESWQTKDQITVTIKVNYLPEVVEFSTTSRAAGCRCCSVTTSASCAAVTRCTT